MRCLKRATENAANDGAATEDWTVVAAWGIDRRYYLWRVTFFRLAYGLGQ